MAVFMGESHHSTNFQSCHPTMPQNFLRYASILKGFSVSNTGQCFLGLYLFFCLKQKMKYKTSEQELTFKKTLFDKSRSP